MDPDLLWMITASSVIVIILLMRMVNEWYYVVRLGKKQPPLPPGQMGWPLLGNSISFITAFKSSDPDSFVNHLVSRYGKIGIYRTHVLGSPCVVVCKPEICWRVLTDDKNFKLGYPGSALTLLGSRTLIDASAAQYKRFRRLTTAPIVGHHALAVYIERIEDIIITSLEELASMKHPVELLEEMKKITFKVTLCIFMGSSDSHSITTKMGDLFTPILNGLFALPINAPGFAFHKAIKARRKLEEIIKSVVEERRWMMKSNVQQETEKDLIDTLLEAADEGGRKLDDDEIVDLIILFLFAGHETSAIGMMWSIIHLTHHPHILDKAKEEVEEITKIKPASQKRLYIKEIKQMVYLGKVVNETLRRSTITLSAFREANVDVNVNGYTIPKGWRILIWTRAVHMDPENYLNPKEFNPSRWDDYNAKIGSFIPFGAGMHMCPGGDLAKLKISIFLYYFLLNYKLERVNPKCSTTWWPVPRPTDNCLARIIKLGP